MYSESELTIRLWSLTEDVLVEGGPGQGPLTVVTRWGEFTFHAIDARSRESLRRMSLGPVSLDNILPHAGHPDGVVGMWDAAGTAGPGAAGSQDAAGVAGEPGAAGEPGEAGAAGESREAGVAGESREAGVAGEAGVQTLDQVLDVLSGSVVHSLGLDDRQGPLLSAVPTARAATFALHPVAATRVVRLSRYALLRPYGDGLMLESPSARFRVLLHRPLATHIASALATPRTVAQLASELRVAAPIVGRIVEYLVAAGIAVLGDQAGRFGEDTDPALRLWAHHELLFHVRSRSRYGNGEAKSADDATAIAPVVKPAPAGRRYPLHQPRIAQLLTDDARLTALLESANGVPDMSANEVTAEQLGELLFRSARVRGPGPARLPHDLIHQASQRPYLSIAGLYELEIYLSLERCAGLPRGIFHYDPAAHALTQLTDDDAYLSELLELARVAAGSTRRPPALITVTARMDRMAGLGGAAYATTLMHLGALQQTLYLVAKAMGLRAHAVPVDANDSAERAIGLSWPAEVGVGECVIDRPN